MPAALRSEWIKLSTLRANKVILGLTAAIGAVIAWALAATATDASADRLASCSSTRCPLVAMLADGHRDPHVHRRGPARHAGRDADRPSGALGDRRGQDRHGRRGRAGARCHRHGRPGSPARRSVASSSGSGSRRSSSRALWALLYIALAALIGLGVGMIVRHSAGAISGLLMWSFVVESLFAPALPDGVLHFLPFSAGYRLLDAGPNFEAPVRHRQRARPGPQYAAHLRRLRRGQPGHRHGAPLPAGHQLSQT